MIAQWMKNVIAAMMRFILIILFSFIIIGVTSLWGQWYLSTHTHGLDYQTIIQNQSSIVSFDRKVQENALTLWLKSDDPDKRNAAKRLTEMRPPLSLQQTQSIHRKKSKDSLSSLVAGLRNKDSFLSMAILAYLEIIQSLLLVQIIFLLGIGIAYQSTSVFTQKKIVFWIYILVSIVMVVLLLDVRPYLDPNEIPGYLFHISVTDSPLWNAALEIIFPLIFGGVYISGWIWIWNSSFPEKELLIISNQPESSLVTLFRLACARAAEKFQYAIPYFVMAILFVQAKVEIAGISKDAGALSVLVKGSFGFDPVNRVIYGVLLIVLIMLATFLGQQFFSLVEESLLSRIKGRLVR